MSQIATKKKAEVKQQIEQRNPYRFILENEASQEKMKKLLELAGALHVEIMTLQPTREASIAITKLEETLLWVNKAVKVMQENPIRFV